MKCTPFTVAFSDHVAPTLWGSLSSEIMVEGEVRKTFLRQSYKHPINLGSF